MGVWDCWLGDHTGANKVHFADDRQPNPIPVPTYSLRKSDEECIPGESVPGDTVLQRPGWGPGRLKVILPSITRETLDAIKALYFRYSSGQHLPVQFFDSEQTFLCAWDSDWAPVRRNSWPERYRFEFDLIIESVVVEV